MSEPTCTEAQKILLAFAQRCFIGTESSGSASNRDHSWVRERVTEVETLTPGEVALWPLGKQEALREMFNDAIIFLEFQRRSNGDRMPTGTLDGSTSDQLAQPLLSGIALAQESLHG